MAVYSAIFSMTPPTGHETTYGKNNDLPPNFKEITETEFAQSIFFSYLPEAVEYRQCLIPNVNDNCYCGVRFFYFHNGTGIAMTSDYRKGKISYFKFAACNHTFQEIGYARCKREKGRHLSRWGLLPRQPMHQMQLRDGCGFERLMPTIIKVIITSGGERTFRSYESDEDLFKEALREVMGKILAGMSSVPEKIEIEVVEWSDAYRKFRSCTSKKQYVIKAQAEHDAAEVTRRTNQEKTVYSCIYCNCWHVGESKYSARKFTKR